MKERIWGIILHQILEVDFDDFAPIKTFLLVWGCDDKQRRLVVATNGRGWWRRSL